MQEPVKIPLSFVMGREGRVRLLRSDDERVDMRKAITEAKDDAQRKMWQSVLDEEDQLRKAPGARFWNVSFRIPDFNEVSEIRADANRYRPDLGDFVWFRDLELPIRVRRLFFGITDKDGNDVSVPDTENGVGSRRARVDDIPAQLISYLGAKLEPWFGVGGALSDFLGESAEPSARESLTTPDVIPS